MRAGCYPACIFSARSGAKLLWKGGYRLGKKNTLSAYENVSSALLEVNEIMEATLSTHCFIFTQFLHVQGILRTAMMQLQDTEQQDQP